MRLIDAEALKAKWYKINGIDENDRGARFVGYTEIPRLIDQAPTVEVVQCKDCRHGHKQIKHNGELFYECDLSECEEWFTDDFFCANGERREP